MEGNGGKEAFVNRKENSNPQNILCVWNNI